MKLEEITLFSHLVSRPEADLDLARAALLIAEPEYPGLHVGQDVEKLDDFGVEAAARIASSPQRPPLEIVVRYLYEELGFHGNTQNYYDPRNSFLNEVLDRRTGIPISLALVYMEVARRAGVRVEGVNFPGHFLLRCPARRGLPQADDLIIDPFHGGALLSDAACRERL